MEVEFRIANANDLEGIVDLCNKVFEERTTYEYAKKVFEKTQNDFIFLNNLFFSIQSYAKMRILVLK